MIKLIEFLINKRGDIISLSLEHIKLTVFAVVISIIIGVPLGLMVARYKRISKPIMGFANLMQAVPSLALLGFLIPIMGIGGRPAIVMVVLYSLLPIIKNTYTGITSISSDTLESAKGIGMTNMQILKKIQIPLALPIIMAGIRISSVTAVGLMTIAAFIGAGGLGYMVFSGIQTVNNDLILAGAIPACIMALCFDFIVGKIELLVSPNGIKDSSGAIIRKKKISKGTRNAIVFLLAAATILLVVKNIVFKNEEESITIGTKNFTEQIIMGNIISDLIEEKTDIKVNRKFNLGGTQVAFEALKNGSIDGYVEYTGTALVSVLNNNSSMNADEAYDYVKSQYKDLYDIRWLNPLGFNNTYTLAVTENIAEEYNLKTISDLAKVSNELSGGFSIEFNNREDGYVGLKSAYNINLKNVDAIDGGLRYTALNEKKVEVIDAFLTDGLIKGFNLKILEDDKKFFPPYYAVPILRNDTLKKYPELEEIINNLAGIIDDEKMRDLNYKVDEQGEEPEKVAKDFLKEEGFLK